MRYAELLRKPSENMCRYTFLSYFI